MKIHSIQMLETCALRPRAILQLRCRASSESWCASIAWVAYSVVIMLNGHAFANEGSNTDQEASILDIFPTSSCQSQSGVTHFNDRQGKGSLSGSNWSKGLEESKVFHALLRHESDPMQSWSLRVGKGGQVYSLIGPFGESVPPQTVDSRWNDEVWQFVATSAEEIEPIHEFERATNDFAHFRQMEYFIHQSGTYSRIDPTKGSFYSPCLRMRYNPAQRSLEMLNWIQQANAPAVWTSGLLVYSRYRDVGGGAIEVTYVFHNFGDERLEYLNTPWGGVRKSSLPHTIMFNDDGAWEEVTGAWGWEDIGSRPLRDTAGWCAWTQDPTKDSSPTLALVFGKDQHSQVASKLGWLRAPLKVRWGTAAEPERDYQATEIVFEPNFEPGDTMYFRYYFVVGTFAEASKRARELVQCVDYGPLPPFENALSTEAVRVKSTKDGLPHFETGGAGDEGLVLRFLTQPIEGAKPVFLLKDNYLNRWLLTTDPYALATSTPFKNPLPADHKEHAKYESRRTLLLNDGRATLTELLGYAVIEPIDDAAQAEWISLDEALGNFSPAVAIDQSCKQLFIPK